MFGIGSSELLIILLIVVIVFGASRLPKLGKGLGEGLRGFKDALKGDTEDDDKKKGSGTTVARSQTDEPPKHS